MKKAYNVNSLTPRKNPHNEPRPVSKATPEEVEKFKKDLKPIIYKKGS